MRPLDVKGHMILVSFALCRMNALSDAELEVARRASASATNADIARARQTSTHTVARQMSSVLSKLGIGSRLGLATLPELSAWAPPDHSTPSDGEALDALLRTTGPELGPDRVLAIWREVASGRWKTLAGVDAGWMRHATMRRDPGEPVDWLALDRIHWAVLALVADGLPRKVVAMKLGLAPSTVSSVLAVARRRLGFASPEQLLRAYCAVQGLHVDRERRLELRRHHGRHDDQQHPIDDVLGRR